MTVPVDPGTGLQDDVDLIFVGGATGLHARFLPLYTILSGGLSSDNFDLTSNFTWTGVHSFESGDLKLGDSDASHKYVFVGSNLAANRNVTLPLLASDDTFVFEAMTQTLTNKTISAGAFSGTSTFTGDLSLAATKKLYLDGGGNTYLIESSADVVDAYVGGASVLTLTTSSIALGSGVDFKVQSGKKLYLDGGGNTYVSESSADVVVATVGGLNVLTLTTSSIALNSDVDFKIQSTKKLYLDGGGNTYIEEQSSDVIRLVCGGTAILAMNSTIVALPSTAYLYFDGGGDTYIRESSANVLDIYVGGTKLLSASTSDLNLSGNILPSVDINYNLGSTSKRWGSIYSYDYRFTATGAAQPTISSTNGTIDFSPTDNGSLSRTIGFSYANAVYTAGAPTVTGYIGITVGGTAYKIAVST